MMIIFIVQKEIKTMNNNWLPWIVVVVLALVIAFVGGDDDERRM